MGGHRHCGVRAWGELKRPKNLRFCAFAFVLRVFRSIFYPSCIQTECDMLSTLRISREIDYNVSREQ
jgi:hypothetical protein